MFFFIFLYFLRAFEKWNLIFWKNYANFLTITQTTRCNFWLVSQFSKDRDIPMVIGKLRNQSKFAPGGLRNCQTIFFLEKPFLMILQFHQIALFWCTQMTPNVSEMSKYHPFWVRTHFGYFKPWFGAIILLFYHSFWRRE